jgi:plasmid stabilization system protein ParE
MRVDFADEAEFDLESIGDFIAQDNPLRAATFVEELRDRCFGLAEFPLRFPLLDSYRRSGIRKFVHGSYLVFYLAESEAVSVVRILHGASDYEALLFPEKL